MTYKLGIVVGLKTTSWSALGNDIEHDGDPGGAAPPGGVVDSVVGLLDGEMIGGSAVASAPHAQHVTSDFVSHLGESEPMMIGGTPYGAEALIGHLISSVVNDARSQLGSDPTTVVLVHDDGIDEYRIGLWSEAGRLAGIPVADLVLVPRATAAAAQSMADPGGPQLANGAAQAGWQMHPDTPIVGGTGAAAGSAIGVVSGAGAAVAGGAVLATTALGGEAAAAATSAAAGVAGPAGAPIAAPAGPTGTPITPAGPTGTPITPAGPTGTPITPAGPTGTPITPAGPTGTPITPAGPTGTPIPGLTGKAAREAGKRSYKVPIIVGGVAVIGLIVGISVMAGNNDDPPAATATTVAVGAADDPAAPTISGATGSVDVPASTTPQAVTSPPTSQSAGSAAIACTQGTWTMNNDSFADMWLSIAAAEGDDAILESVNGSVTVTVGDGGVWTSVYNDWGLTASADGGSIRMTLTITGTDETAGTFAEDGTMTFVDTNVNSRVTLTASAEGIEIPIPTQSDTRSAFSGAGTFTCEGDTLTVNVDENPGPITMTRTS